ncbi:MAG: hypothetical protein AB1597_01655 [Chloroflexota bacterium]
MLSELLKQIECTLNGEISLSALEDWLVSHLQSILDSGDAQAIEIANGIDADLIEYRERILDIEEILNRLQAFLARGSTIVVEFGDVPTSKTLTASQDIPVRTKPIVISDLPHVIEMTMEYV